MADDANNQTHKPQQAVPAIQMHNQYIKDLSLEIPYAPEIFKELNTQPNIKVDVNVGAAPLEENIYKVELSFRLDGDTHDKKLFIMEMTYAGVVSLNIPAEHVDAVLMVEIPHLLFPYARQAISSTMINGGLPSLMLSPIDFVAMYQARMQSKTAKMSS